MLQNKTISKILTSLLLLASIVLINFLNSNSRAFNHFYQYQFYPFLSKILRAVFGWLPFSMGDIFYATLILFVIYRLVIFIRKIFKKERLSYFSFLCNGLNLGLLLYFIFLVFWGLNYQRDRVSDTLGLQKKEINLQKLLQLTQLIIEKANATYPAWKAQENSGNIAVYTTQAFDYYNITAHQYPIFRYQNLSFKTSIFNNVISKMGTMGYYQPFLGEGTLNGDIPKVDIPFIICHEMAHQLGIAYEDEAHLMAVMAILQSKNSVFEFSAHINMLDYLLSAIAQSDEASYQKMLKSIRPEIIQIFKTRNDYWRKEMGFMNQMTSVIFDILLKANHQDKGIQSYQDITIWLYSIYFKS